MLQEYCILESIYPDKLTSQINNLIKDGWKPQGGLSVVVQKTTKDFLIVFDPNVASHERAVFRQAMVKSK